MIRHAWLPYIAAAAYCAIFFAAYGMGIGMIDSYTALSQNLFAALPQSAQTLYTSPLGPFIGHVLGIHTQTGYILFSLAGTALVLGVLVWSVVREAGDARRALEALLLIVLTPLVATLFSNVGKTDPFIILWYLMFVAVRHPLLRNAAVFLLLLSHREVGVLMLVVHLLLTPGEWRRWYESVPGALAALGALGLYHLALPPYAGRVDDVLDPSSWSGWIGNVKHFPLVWWAGFGWFWGIIGWSVWNKWLPSISFFAALAIPLGAAIITLDTTRITMLVGFPIVWVLVKKFLERDETLPYGAVLPLLLLSFVQSRYQTPDFRFIWTNWHTSPIDQMKVWVERYWH